jgi:hypothetical protein
MSSRTSLPLVLVLALFVLGTAVGAAAQPGRSAQADLSTSKGIAAYLRSKGIDPAGFVVQRGARNYAGPNCPGRGWSCTKDRKVVQVSSRHGHNVAECGPGGTLTTAPSAITCVVVQSSTYGRNDARCGLKSRDATPIVLDCRIEQTNQKGDNVARVKQRSDQNEGADQRATLNALVRQTTSSGDNRSDLKQLIEQSTHDVAMATPAQNQEGRFTAQVTQTSETGVNTSELLQRLDQSGKAKTGAQRQFSDQHGDVDQTNGEAEPSTQSTSRSKWKHKRKSFSISRADQFEAQRLRGPGPQTQIGPQFCCATQTGGDSDRTDVRIRQESRQTASQDDAVQTSASTGECTTVGDCAVRQRLRDDEDSIKVRQNCSGSENEPCTLNVVTTCETQADPYKRSSSRHKHENKPEVCVTSSDTPSVTKRRR